jgi:lambda repressor-like predicted transcriptional regulator
MHKERIKAEIRIKHGSLREFERARGLPARSVEDVLRGRAVRQTADAIAEFMGTSITALFPGRFTRKPLDTSASADSHCLNDGAV